MKNLIVCDIPLRIGGNKLENELIINSMKDNDTWFHISDFPSAHMAIEADYTKLSKSTIYRISLELKKHSKFKKSNNIAIIYTHRKNVKLTNTVGTVIIDSKYKIVNT